MKTKTELYNDITKHGEDLNAIFNTGIEPVKLCKMLLRLERKAHNATTCLCNTNTLNLMQLNRFTGYEVKQATEEEQDEFFGKILKSLEKIIGKENMPYVFINHDPRGYSLKIKAEFIKDLSIAKDWGGYGILAPDLN